ncbi:hypothetical protein CBM2609_B70003 [Cupriavidus taiwanensis]|uniref:Uncharacterized protein n=1 Tax=Cupriavidus taiwanensis TaxID=164546 RepID=A0A976B3D1_9BURK|nr:hypothetical protein CBM2604_B60002 [Cupriavidus taiwanensis]SOZ33046.1 hypothetical protein CBM2609_B70003 [Cupriavidus taiwanensis]SOZ48373.1 hypothetical protein CBM2610_B50002 [Cupriavidus taiwanensis]SOZ62606.1 hypothetical protein CBM2614_B100002 [Cupriavidus taiwanensis]SOZ62851.1 hypothetical protein CBM2615_B100002 [Cupriavidus taiwanensis]
MAAAAEIDEGRGRLSRRAYPGNTLESCIFRADFSGPPIPPDWCPRAPLLSAPGSAAPLNSPI